MSKRKYTKTKPNKHEQMPERIPDSPENIMRALCRLPKEHEWEYLKAEKAKA